VKPLFFVVSLLACASSFAGSALQYDPETPLYTSEPQAHTVASLPAVLDRLTHTGRPLVLFIHGRGDEPRKSLRKKKSIFGLGSAVAMLETQYGARVVMFNWNAKSSGKDRKTPLSHMVNAVDALHEALGEFRTYYDGNPSQRPFVLLAHSMGTIVLQRYVEHYGWIDGRRLFAAVLLTSADADNVGHTHWVEKISAIENVFITVNPADKTLMKSMDQRPANMLPLGRDPGELLAKGARYVEIGATGHHEVFDKRDMQGRVAVCRFFSEVLTGSPWQFGLEDAANVIDGQRYRLLSTYDKAAKCFDHL
jgi:hypothetical protein